MTRPISKSRFNDFVAIMETNGVRDIDLVIQGFREVFEFDPDASTYDPVKGAQFMAWRRNKVLKNKEQSLQHNENATQSS